MMIKMFKFLLQQKSTTFIFWFYVNRPLVTFCNTKNCMQLKISVTVYVHYDENVFEEKYSFHD